MAEAGLFVHEIPNKITSCLKGMLIARLPEDDLLGSAACQGLLEVMCLSVNIGAFV